MINMASKNFDCGVVVVRLEGVLAVVIAHKTVDYTLDHVGTMCIHWWYVLVEVECLLVGLSRDVPAMINGDC